MLNTSDHPYLKKMNFRSSALLLTIIIFATACSPAVTEPTLDIQATLAHNVSGTLTASAPSPTVQIPTIAPLPTSTPAPQPAVGYSGLPALVNVTSIVLRSGPSTLFEKLTTFPQGTAVTIMGKITNSEWVWVITPNASAGWMSAQFLNPVDLSEVPVMDVPSSYTITGTVLDMVGQGVDGINIAVFQGSGPNQLRTDTYTSVDGSFIVYLPDTSLGFWNVGTAGIKCTSRIMDANCNATGSIITPTFSILLPQTASILFNYDPNTP